MQKDRSENQNQVSGKFVSLPYIPGISGKLKKVFSDVGFNVAFKSGRNLESMFTSRNKPKLPRNSYPGCYKVPCFCGGNYIGHTKKKGYSRFGEHEKAIYSGHTADSALSEHAINKCSKDIDWENASMINTEPRYFKRCIREALEIQKEQVGSRKEKLINREEGLYVTTSTWKNLLQKIAKEEK